MARKLMRVKNAVKASLEHFVSPRLSHTSLAHNFCEKLNKRSKERLQRERQSSEHKGK